MFSLVSRTLPFRVGWRPVHHGTPTNPEWRAPCPVGFSVILARLAHPDTPIPRHPDIPTPRHPDTPTSRHPDTPTSRHPDIPTPRHPDIPTSRHPDTPISRHPMSWPGRSNLATWSQVANFQHRLGQRICCGSLCRWVLPCPSLPISSLSLSILPDTYYIYI